MTAARSDCVQALFSRTRAGIRPGLSVMTALLDELGSPQNELKAVHVAGTNGKGSVCALIDSVLRASGFKTGLYTSPHLQRFNERFRISGAEISNRRLDDVIRRVLQADEACLARGRTDRPGTFFELATAMAFLFFRQESVDYAVIETGLGGRWDATNTLNPVLSVITRIDMDHADLLGDSLEAIAAEKAGIIKPGAPVICGPMPVEAEAVIYRRAAECGVPILGSSEAVLLHPLESRRTDHLLDIEVGGREYRHVRLPLGGTFQIENAGIAIAALDDLGDLEGFQPEFKKGLEQVAWPGRFQMLSMRPPVVYDAAHNPSGVRALLETLQPLFPTVETGFVVGFMRDKAVDEILRVLAPAARTIWALTLPGERAMPAEQIADIGRKAGMEVHLPAGPQPVLDWLNGGKKRMLCFTGSLRLAGELRKFGFAI